MAKVIKKVNRLETHDRLEHFNKSEFDIGKCVQDLVDKQPFGKRNFYIFAHSRTEDDQIGVKRIIWQPRLTKPLAQENSMLFKSYANSDKIKVIWMIPAREMWDQFLKGKMFHNQIIVESIFDFQNNKSKLEQKEEDDPSDKEIDSIYQEIARSAKKPEIIK